MNEHDEGMRIKTECCEFGRIDIVIVFMPEKTGIVNKRARRWA